MTSKSASAALADGIAFSSRSRAASAALDAGENPRISDGGEGGVVGCADNQLAVTTDRRAATKYEGRCSKYERSYFRLRTSYFSLSLFMIIPVPADKPSL